ncbi:hypothetical protein AGMMS50229_00570 [Campylobacterota bacterium]|nr:hypothetical protein AGMMS50229_00570 [Campylobacterota bacterium]
MKTPFATLAIIAIATTLLSSPSYAADPQGLFITGGLQQFVSPDDPIDNPSAGVRIGAGYEFPLNMGGGVTLLTALLA